MSRRKVCVVTGSRAEYGLLYWIMRGLQNSPLLELQVIVTGMHLSPEFGLTYRTLEQDGFIPDKKVEMLLSADTATAISKSTALGIIGMADAFEDLQPDLALMLGDRFEILSAAIAATFQRIPIAHIHGGESTFGLIDEPIRHSISKMSHLHFTATETYRNRVIQLGEQPDRVFNVGAVGLDNIHKLELLGSREMEKELDLSLNVPTVMVTFHPVTLDRNSAEDQINALLEALEPERYQIVFTLPNADTDGRIIRQRIEEFQTSHSSRVRAFTSLGQLRYLSALQYMTAVVGNSSSGLIEVPAFHIPTINIGDRQAGRIAGPTVIQCEPSVGEIRQAIHTAFDPKFRDSIRQAANPYGEGGASEKIVSVLESEEFAGLIKKSFYDMPGSSGDLA
ncbi:MAG: UDP-N-acetylglucosamine 2-epimerase (hydrolyzing), partial [Leptospiraceae bacterium]|nr:UDP-N-acetylglucosamine 2-epimerase (hydrolyzing) [Leptospiraceae bacterium]